MSKKLFSNEEIEILSNNKYVKNFSEKGITYTKFIFHEGSKAFMNDEYSIDLAKHSRDSNLLDILNLLGGCNYLWKFYENV